MLETTFSNGAKANLAPSVDTQDALEVYRRLNLRIEATKSIRFQANVRLMRRHRLSGHLVAMLSLYVIALSLLPNIFALHNNQNQMLLAITILMSTFIIVISHTEGSESFHHSAEVLRESARDINELSLRMSVLTIGSEGAQPEFLKIASEYNDAVRRCSINHENCDYLWVKARRPEIFEGSSIAKTLYGRLWNGFLAAWGEFAWIFTPAVIAISSLFVVYRTIRFW